MNLISMALLGMLALPLAACSSKDGSTNAAATPTATTTTTTATTETRSPAVTDRTVNNAPATSAVRQQVQVNAGAGKVVVTVSVENGTAAPVYVPKAVFEDDEIFRREFQITDKASGAEVDYIGPMVKRGPFTRDDYLAVAPGARLANSIDITRSYDFRSGVTYQLAYPGAYLGDLAMLDAATSVPVAPVTFTFGAK